MLREGDVADRELGGSEPPGFDVLADIEVHDGVRPGINQEIAVQGVESRTVEFIGIQPHSEQPRNVDIEADLLLDLPTDGMGGKFVAIAEATRDVPMALPWINRSPYEQYLVAGDHQGTSCWASVAVVSSTARSTQTRDHQVDPRTTQGAVGKLMHQFKVGDADQAGTPHR